jgi:hypothetical protein
MMSAFSQIMLAMMTCLVQPDHKAENDAHVFYQWTLQLWEWESDHFASGAIRIPERAKVSELVIYVRQGDRGFGEARTGNRILGFIVEERLNQEGKSVFHIGSYVKGRNQTEAAKAANEEMESFDQSERLVSKITFGERIKLASGEHSSGEVVHCNAFTCTVVKKSRQEFLDATKMPMPSGRRPQGRKEGRTDPR